MLSRVRWAAGSLRTTAYVQGFLGAYTPGALGARYDGGAFWDGRAEGCGATGGPDCQVGTGTVSETITPDDLPVGSPHVEFLGPVADQALNPTSRPGVEQNTREKSDCQIVKTAKYKDLFEQAWGEPIDCNQQGDPPAYHISFKRLAVAVAAWQGSPDVNSFSSPRDECIRRPAQFDDGRNAGQVSVRQPERRRRTWATTCSMAADTGIRPGRNRPARRTPAVRLVTTTMQPLGRTATSQTKLYTDIAYHSIALPFNRELSRDDEDPGLFAHDDLPGNVVGLGDEGLFKTPPLRNVAKNQLGITKAFMHNGYFKNIEDVVHFYNTRFDGTPQDTVDPNPADQPQRPFVKMPRHRGRNGRGSDRQ